MTIEETLSRLAINSGRIASALEAIASAQGIVPDAPEAAEPEAKPAASKKKTSKKTAKKKASKKKASKKTTVGKAKKEAEVDLTIKDDVRPVLKRLRDEVSHAAVKSLLKKFGASTIQQLEPENFQRIIDAAMEQLGDDDDLDDDIDDGQGDLLDDDDDL